MMRKNLHSPESLSALPSLLGHYFRVATFDRDDFDYDSLVSSSAQTQLEAWLNCRNKMGMHTPPPSPSAPLGVASAAERAWQRQQYVS